MRNFFVGLVVLITAMAYGQTVNSTIQPSCFYRLTEKHSTPDSLFYNSDSSYRPTYDNGNRANCKGLWVRRGTPSGEIVVHPLQRSDTTATAIIYIDSASDGGYYIPFLFDKFFKVGTTIPWDSVGYIPDIGK